MSCSTLPLEIAEHGLTHCYYLTVHCRQHGEIRIGTDQEPSDHYPCPVCGKRSPAVLLGEGGTLRSLPFWSHFGEGREFHQEMLKQVWAMRKMHRRPV